MKREDFPTFEEINSKSPSEKTPLEKLYMTALVFMTGHPNCVGKGEKDVHDDLMLKWAPILDF